MDIPHNYAKYGLDTAKCWTVCIMELFRVGVITRGEFGKFFHPRFLDGDPVDEREHQIVTIVTQVLADEPYFLSLARRERVAFTVPEEVNAPILSEKENLEAVKKDPSSIRFIVNPSVEVQLAAIEIDPTVLKFIKTPCFEALMKVNGIGGAV